MKPISTFALGLPLALCAGLYIGHVTIPSSPEDSAPTAPAAHLCTEADSWAPCIANGDNEPLVTPDQLPAPTEGSADDSAAADAAAEGEDNDCWSDATCDATARGQHLVTIRIYPQAPVQEDEVTCDDTPGHMIEFTHDDTGTYVTCAG